MCGLAGIATIGGAALSAEADAVLTRMTHAVAHRGPDDVRLLSSGPVGLGFRRLALVDPSNGDQPLFSADESAVLIANGEVYNHTELEAGISGVQLRTKSDCEVLAHLYARDGLRFLDQVCGMYAVALWDRRRNRLVLARDRFGIKPLYYAHLGDTAVFASEIKALFTHPRCPRDLDWEGALADQSMTIAPRFSHEPVTSWFRGIHTVPAGTIVTIDLGTGQTDQHTYWSLPDFEGNSDLSDAEFVTAYRELLAASVADCASADAELGLFLSGGIDSGAVAALARAEGASIHTFTLLNGSTFANGDAEYAHRTAAALGVPNHQLLVDPDRFPAADEWKRLLWLLETPLCGPEQYFKFELYRYAKQLRPELRGMLLGQASDEYNGGYSVDQSLDTDWAGFEANVAWMARATALTDRPALATWWDHPDGPVLADGLLGDGAAGVLADPYPAFVAWKHRHLQQYHCWHEDRTAAGNGVEARVPFLDHRIIELLATIPATRRAGLLWDKRILRESVRDLLPAPIVERPKQPFYHGDAAGFTHRAFVQMLAQDGQALIEEAVSSSAARDHLRPDGLRAMLARLSDEPSPTDVEYLLRLTNLGLLHNMTRELPAAPVDAPRREIPAGSPIVDWDRDSGELAPRFRRVPEPDAGDVVALASAVLAVHTPSDPDTLYLAVDGQFEYVVDTATDPAWSAFLRHVDGERTLGEVLAAASVTYNSVATSLRYALDADILVSSRRFSNSHRSW